MHLYDFPIDAEIITGSGTDYYTFIDKNYFDVCNNARVIEVGPFYGNHTKLITNHKPSYLECVEGNINCKSVLEKIPGVDNVVVDDIWLLTTPQPFDIVICFGVLYHHHSALHLLELFVNFNDPEYIILDCVTAEHPLAYLPEESNTPGNRQVRGQWKNCGINLTPPFFIVNQSLTNMGYKLDIAHKLQTQYFSKSDGWVARWKKEQINDQPV